MCDTFTDWEQHVAEVTNTEDQDHASLLSVQLSTTTTTEPDFCQEESSLLQRTRVQRLRLGVTLK